MEIASVFNRHKFLLHQKHLSISETYKLWDESGQELLLIKRPRKIILNALVLLLGLVVFFGVIIGGVVASGKLLHGHAIAIVGSIVGGGVGMLAVFALLMPKRHIYFYTDLTQSPILTAHEVKRMVLRWMPFDIFDESGALVGRLEKDFLFQIFRKRWVIKNPAGEIVAIAKEDSILKAILRKFLGNLFGLLRTNFIITQPESDEALLGQFNRTFTLLDKYVLDLSYDPQFTLDRRIAVALAVLLDTGENR